MPKAKQKTCHTLTQEYVESSESSDSEYNSDDEAMLFQGKDPVLDRCVYSITLHVTHFRLYYLQVVSFGDKLYDYISI